MNFVSQRIFSGFRILHPLRISPFDKEKLCLLLNNPSNTQVRTKMRLTNPGIFAIRDKKKEKSWNDRSDSIGGYGYALLGIPILTFILGTWQVQRRRWKLGLIEDLQERITSEPELLPKNLDDLATKEYHPVRVRGTFLHDKAFTMGPRSLIVDGEALTEHQPGFITKSSTKGSWLITPFKLEDRDLTILVNRGWVPEHHKKLGKMKEPDTDGVVDIVGLVRMNEKRPTLAVNNDPERNLWHYRNLNQMAEYMGTAPVYIDQVFDKSQSKYPVGGQTRISLRNEHLQYAITWYGLSAVTALMWYRNFVKRIRI